mmetsp:Transcript_50270/g.116700  ORF Transcript_50270/g.116700 Transcript_50270/m.116700 type:complete len:153 (-) Transcript_50270:95-553(-)|eukprot:CAMPEP_0171095438 /NCGR_PEP_ID=MMETSP0766_2-20121228/43171_1 /TAXON_ID=439317 /ORGANISM="Gambierdiscus australes, Strain CAWD 149" /LENGTH=152 /DNA_ID=CAMNT_0011554243 /DNA_START=72 /DNA_END=530 /DNA_ORIENTATION=-
MSPPAIPKVAIPQEKWTATVYGTPEACLAKTEPGKLTSMQFDPTFFSNAYVQCLGRGLASKDCAASLADDLRVTPAGPLAPKDVTAAVACMSETGDPEKCIAHFDALAKLAGYEEPVKESMTQKAKGFASKAGWKLLGVPVAYYGLKFIKIK